MTSLLIVLAMPDHVIARYERPLRARFPAIEINAVNHRDRCLPVVEANLERFLAGAPQHMMNRVSRS